ncbi:hypothetical protein [Methanofollis fontis]|uniref:Uncharacterized protein n=1 Tax=Methanofollis fontis TaxID=2052832 RepID=A0A483CYI7_9EURY|nr:hypothetical protein [Methanofollis fontis]TAJ44726.1 hypothetical protein CUJ86_05355 [Methanofollis fontis]
MTEFQELIEIADRLLDEAEDDDVRLVRLLDGLDPSIRDELLTSDLLNAYQAYLFAFREFPGELQMERLMLSPASSTLRGVFLEEVDVFSLVFVMGKGGAEIVVTDGEEVYARFTGKGAKKSAENYVLDELA